MFVVHPSPDREHMIAGYAMPDGTMIRHHVPMRALVDRALAGIGNAEPEAYDEIRDGVLSELGIAVPPQIGLFKRFRRRIKRIAKKVKKVAKKIAKTKLVKAAWKIVNNPLVQATMGPFAAVPASLSSAAKVVQAIKRKGASPSKALGKLALAAKRGGLGKDAQTSLRLAARAIKGANGNLDKAELALRKTALKAVARKSPQARNAINAAVRKIEVRTQAQANAKPPAALKVFAVKGPSGKLYHFRAA